MTNSVDPYQTADQDLHCLLKPTQSPAVILGQRGARSFSAWSYKNEGIMRHVIC